MVTTSLRVTRPLLVVVVVVSFTTVPSGWVVVVVLLVVELELVVTGEGGTTIGAGLVLDDEQPATQPHTTIRETRAANLGTELMNSGCRRSNHASSTRFCARDLNQRASRKQVKRASCFSEHVPARFFGDFAPYEWRRRRMRESAPDAAPIPCS